MNAIEVTSLKKRFGKNFWALKGIDLKIKKGQIYGLLGPNGAGKTTLIYILSTMLLPTSGTAKVLGLNVDGNEDEIREKTGLCLGGTYFYWDLTAREILQYFGRLYGIPSQRREKRINYLTKALGMQSFGNKQFSQLSTGMRQKLALAKSLINEPEVLFLDEPTAGLDVEVSINIRNFIKDLIQENDMTVLLTSHSLYEVEDMCKRIAIINQGRLVVEGKISDIRKRLKIPDIIHLYLDKYNDFAFLDKVKGVISHCTSDGLFISVDSGLKRLKPVTNALERRGFRIRDLEIEKASLEEVFLSIIGQKGGKPRAFGRGVLKDV